MPSVLLTLLVEGDRGGWLLWFLIGLVAGFLLGLLTAGLMSHGRG